jgi:hypothetical protein
MRNKRRTVEEASDINNKYNVGIEIMHASALSLNPRRMRRISFGPAQPANNDYENGVPAETQQGRKTRHDHDDELLDAPWYQNAWMEEIRLRLAGHVVFGEALVPAKRLFPWTRSTAYYRSTVPSCRPWWEHWLVPSFLWRSNPAGHDRAALPVTNWASNKPHAVVADGVALQQLPNALRTLQLMSEQNCALVCHS